MRNKVQLYIGGKRADLDDGSFILFTYTAEELTNPTIVRNSFSRQITLKGTPANDEIFGHIYRNDRLTQYGGGTTGPDFDPTRKTPFTVYNEMGEILEDGYLKLNKVVRKGRTKEYAVTLYGGLGSFLYGLSYDTLGNKRTLADLDFGYALDFVIERATVKAAWDQLYNDPDAANKWSVINFIPAYNGLPSGEFNADKAVVHAATCGLQGSDGTYQTQGGFTLVSLPEKVTGNEAKDYRSYLQKPVVRMKAVINAICNSANNGGYTVNLDSEFFDDSNPYWSKTWLTLPLLTDLNIASTETDWAEQHPSLSFSIPNGGVASTMYEVNLYIEVLCSQTGGQYQMHCEDDWAAGQQGDNTPGFYVNYIEATATLYDANNNILGTAVRRASTMQLPEQYGRITDMVQYIDTSGKLVKVAADHPGSIFVFSFQQNGLDHIEVTVQQRGVAWGHLRAGADDTLVWPYNSYDYTGGVAVTYAVDAYNTGWNGRAVTASTVRTGAQITKAALLSTKHTPADYLLSYCKMFGLQMVVHKDEKVVDITMRKNLYSSTFIDINGRIDRGRGVEKVPFSFDARWYLFGNDAKGDYAEYYANKYGRPYGQFRVNTGYGFDASEKSLTDSIVFNNACDVIETSKYFCDLSIGSIPVPSLFLSGGKYTLYSGGDTEDLDIPIPTTATRSWNNASYAMHDDWPKMQFHGADNAHIDERDTLVFFNGVRFPTSDHITLSDDTIPMLTLNGNAPCWLPGYCDYDTTWKLARMPQFSRHIWNSSNVTKSIDFGTPLEAQVPGINFNAGSNLFEQFWEKYIGDRYDDDSAVVTAWVDLRGMQVGNDLLRQFYAFDGAVWSLNRIIDYSLTTFGPTKCEFVKVQDITNYTTL